MAAIPDFISGAMENWGLVTYREARLLYDSNATSIGNMYDTVTIISHEFAHMWFGNLGMIVLSNNETAKSRIIFQILWCTLVTMDWWNDLWLNEGFASFMQYKSANAIMPDWGLVSP